MAEPSLYQRRTNPSNLSLLVRLVAPPSLPRMSTVSEIESAVAKLSRQELSAFREWFSEFDADAWYRQFEADVAAGHLDALADEAIRDLREGRCRDL